MLSRWSSLMHVSVSLTLAKVNRIANTHCLHHYLDYEWSYTWSWNHIGCGGQYSLVRSSKRSFDNACSKLCSLLDLFTCSLHQFDSVSFLLFLAKYKVHF